MQRLTRFQILILILLPALALAAIVTAAQVAQAILNSPNASAQLKQYASAIGDLAINVESGGNTTAYNGSCCYGVLQMNTQNIWNTLKISPAQYQQLDLQSQVNAWAALTSPLLQAGSVQQLINMGTFDGRQVDGNLVLACMQLGVGNCQKMINSGSCNGFADRNGTTICSMADKIANGSSSNGNGGNGGTGGGGSNGSGGTISQPPCVRDASGACAPINQAMAQAFEGGAGFSMAESKKVIFALISGGMLLLVMGIMKDVWRLYSGGSIEKHVLMRVVFNLALSISMMLFILSYT